MSLSFDKYQAEAISTVGKDILVSASAGAGKTRVLVERLIKRCVEDKIDIDHILAVTFTQAAAAEMKKRVAVRLHQEALTSKDKDYIIKQIMLLENAPITTIDSFCLTIIEKYAHIIGLDKAFFTNVLDENKTNKYLKDSFLEAIRQLDETNHDLILDVLLKYDSRPEDYDEVFKLVKSIISKANANPNPEEWINRLKIEKKIKKINDLPELIQDGFFGQLDLYYNQAMYFLDKCEEIGASTEKVSDQLDLIASTRISLENTKKYLDERNYDMFRESFLNFSYNQKTPSNEKVEPYKKVRSYFYNACEKITDILFDSSILISDYNDLIPINNCLVELALLTFTNFNNTKIKEKCIDFSDMEKYAWQILSKDDCAISKIYQSYFKEVMVDEFQDTSTMQNEIISLLAKKGTTFRVGDVKQSIYRFRQAKPSLMRELSQDKDTKQINLIYNYRSKDNIVDLTNVLFKRLMNIYGCKDSYSSKDEISIGLPTQKLPHEDPCQLVIVEEKEDIPYKSKEAKAKWIAEKIIDLVENKGMNYDDFSILVRSHSDKPIIKAIFNQYNIPYDIDAREGFYQSDLCQTVLSLVRYLIDPSDELSLVSILTSSLYRFDDKYLTTLFIKHGSIISGIQNEHQDIIDDLNRFKDIGDNQGAIVLLDTLSYTHHFYDLLDERQKANFEFLYEKVVGTKSFMSLEDLLEMMDVGSEENSSQAIAKGKDDHLVNVTTIHQSKGLQYKVVFLWGTNKFINQNNSEIGIVSDEGYLGLDHYDLPYRIKRNTLTKVALNYLEELEELEEYTRLLYVALTRAEEKLFIVDSKDSTQDYEDNLSLINLSQRKGITGLLTYALEPIDGLFEINYVEDVPISYRRADKLQKHKTRPSLSIDTYSLDKKITPSQHTVSYLPELNFNQDYGVAYGTRIHTIMAQLPHTKLTEDILDTYDLTDKQKESILSFSNSSIYDEALTMDIYNEYPFYIEDNNERIQGSIDFLAVGKDKLIIIDFKSDHLKLDELKDLYHEQLDLYARAMSLLYPDKKISKYIYSFYNMEYVEV